MFHAQVLMPFFPAIINSNRTPRRARKYISARSTHHSNRGRVAALAGLPVVELVDGLVFPDCAGAGIGSGGLVDGLVKPRSMVQRLN
jgi:hypothetical protein